jgi:diketogulonate reductase-like aldo/keto reductase
LALKTGFEGLDTANYPTAYNESATGEALQEAFTSRLKRENILVCKVIAIMPLVP